MHKAHWCIRIGLISVTSLVVLILTSNEAFAKGRIYQSRAYRPRISRVFRITRRPFITYHNYNRHFHGRYLNRKAKRNRWQSKHKRHVPVQRRSVHGRKSRVRRNKGRYNIFKNTSWRRFKVLQDSTRPNTRAPRMRTLRTFPNVYRGGRWPQSLNVDRNGHYAYLGFDSFANDGSKVLRYNLYRHHFSRTGRTFAGGHAQAVSADHRNNLWFIDRSSNDELDDHEGPINKGSFVEVSPHSLKPIYRKYFRFGRNYMGDNLAFAGKYGVFNLSRIWGRNHTSNHFRRHMLLFYHTNKLDRRGSQWTLLGAIRRTPGTYTIQAVSYNPRDQRLYVGSSAPTDVMSFPVQRILKSSLRRKDIHIMALHLNSNREIEGIAFDHKGYMYMLLGSPGQLLRSRHPVTK